MLPLGVSKCYPLGRISGVRGYQNVTPPKMPLTPYGARDRAIRQKIKIGLLGGIKMLPPLDI